MAKAKSNTEPKKNGRPLSIREEYIEQAYRLSMLGLTDKEMATFFCVSEATFNNWKKEENFLESLKRGKENADAKVVESLYKRAIGYTHKELITASFQGRITDTMEVDKHYPPDTTACIFWLKNRRSKDWRKEGEENPADLNKTILVKYSLE